MAGPRIIIADTDISYLVPLQLKFAERFFEKIDLELISDKAYFDELFTSPQKADILIVSQELYNQTLRLHNIAHIFLMTEQNDEGATGELNINRIFKYTSTKEIFNEIVQKSPDVLSFSSGKKKECQTVLVYSASGGVGKTTLAMGISAALEKQFKRVLYINAAPLQNFQKHMLNQNPVSAQEVYSNLAHSKENSYSTITHVIRKEDFSYLPRFKAAIMSLGLEYGIFADIAEGAKRSGDYDYIIIDADSVFDEERARLINLADRVMIVVSQSSSSLYATNLLVSNMSDSKTDKYVFICNDFDQYEANALIAGGANARFNVSDYVEHFTNYEHMSPADLAKEGSIQRAAVLVM